MSEKRGPGRPRIYENPSQAVEEYYKRQRAKGVRRANIYLDSLSKQVLDLYRGQHGMPQSEIIAHLLLCAALGKQPNLPRLKIEPDKEILNKLHITRDRNTEK